MKYLALLLLLPLAGCGTVQLNCPSDHTVTATLNGPNLATVAQQLAALVGPMMAANAVASKPNLRAEAPAPQTNDGTLSVKTFDIFGVQQYSCGNAAPTPLAK
jgi:hypothetical protein